jgi:CHASE3 domain sensor protein
MNHPLLKGKKMNKQFVAGVIVGSAVTYYACQKLPSKIERIKADEEVQQQYQEVKTAMKDATESFKKVGQELKDSWERHSKDSDSEPNQ